MRQIWQLCIGHRTLNLPTATAPNRSACVSTSSVSVDSNSGLSDEVGFLIAWQIPCDARLANDAFRWPTEIPQVRGSGEFPTGSGRLSGTMRYTAARLLSWIRAPDQHVCRWEWLTRMPREHGLEGDRTPERWFGECPTGSSDVTQRGAQDPGRRNRPPTGACKPPVTGRAASAWECRNGQEPVRCSHWRRGGGRYLASRSPPGAQLLFPAVCRRSTPLGIEQGAPPA
jgi:hypothetical protein